MMEKIKNHYKTNTKWQFLGDLALVLIPAIDTSLMNAPIDDHAKFWAGFVCSNALVAFKFFAKYQNLPK